MRRSVVGLCMLLLAACVPVQQDTEADVAAIREVIAAYDAAVNAGDPAAITALYAEGAVSMPPDTVAFSFEDGQPHMEEMFELNTFQLASVAEEIEVDGDLAYAHVWYEQNVTPTAGGETTAMQGNWVVILRRQDDGSWKMWREMWSYVPPES